jgi:AcrR family transcriptional regulator
MANARERMITSTALLIRERGARATSIDDVLAHSGAPRGSVYHHFPGGRSQLLEEATIFAGDYIAGQIERAPTALGLLDALHDAYGAQLAESNFRAGCPIVAVAVEAGDDDSSLHEHAAAAFERWTGLLTDKLVADGVSRKRARELATLSISAIEGALVLARSRRDPEPFDDVYKQLRSLIQSEL